MRLAIGIDKRHPVRVLDGADVSNDRGHHLAAVALADVGGNLHVGVALLDPRGKRAGAMGDAQAGLGVLVV